MKEKWWDDESALAYQLIRELLRNTHEYGIVDVFSKYRHRVIWQSMTLLRTVHKAARMYCIHQLSSDPISDKAWVEEIAHYAVYASVAYGWKMDFLRGGLRFNDLDILSHRTGVQEEDVLSARWTSLTHRPAYFLVRDVKRKTLVLAIRGTWTLYDLLTDLCCTPQELDPTATTVAVATWVLWWKRISSSYSNDLSTSTAQRCLMAHHGMLESARALQVEVEEIIESEMKKNAEYKLMIVGHSMGGGIAAILAALWKTSFHANAIVYGPPCVASINSHLSHMSNIVSIVTEGDPFCYISLGHVAEASIAVSKLCEDAELRHNLQERIKQSRDGLDESFQEWCWYFLKSWKDLTANTKLYPPGKVFVYSSSTSDSNNSTRLSHVRYPPPTLRKVPHEYFEHLYFSLRMLDLTRHAQPLYEARMKLLLNALRKGK
jgi:predicted esterase